MPRLVSQTPKYRKHRASGQAIVELGGKVHYLGSYGTRASRLEYDRLVMEWLANGRFALPILRSFPCRTESRLAQLGRPGMPFTLSFKPTYKEIKRYDEHLAEYATREVTHQGGHRTPANIVRSM